MHFSPCSHFTTTGGVQTPFSHGMPLQHGVDAEHCCPTAAQSVPPSGGGVAAPHVPELEPGGSTQGRPEQQSALVVQEPPVSTHFVADPLQTNAGFPDGLGVHGRPQQSALEAHAFPLKADGLVQSISAIRQRGMPSESCLQVFFWRTLPAQQFAFALHSVVWRRQMPPAGVHALPFVQRPSAAPPSFAHVTFDLSPSGSVADPQQSLSSLQSSPVGRQPLGG